MPALQKALVLPSPTAQYEVQTVPIPKPAPNEVLVKLLAAALNPADWKIPALGLLGPQQAYPLILGFGGAGIVEEVGSDVTGYEKGDHVVCEGWIEESKGVLHGTFQQYLNVPTYVIAKVPHSMPFEEAVTVYSAVATVAMAFYSQKPGTSSLRLSPPWEDGRGKYAGQSIFVAGGSTQNGQYAIQFAKLSGFHPIITTTSTRNVELAKNNGATHVIDRALPQDKVVEEVHKIASGPVDIAYDGVSDPETIALSIAALRQGGSLVVVQPGQDELINSLAAPKDVKWLLVIGVQSFENNRGALDGLWKNLPELLTEGVIKPTRYELLPGGLRGIPEGLERMRKNEVSGVKLILRPHDTD